MVKNLSLTKILEPKSLFIVAVSGGPDSMFMLDLLQKQNYRLIAAHVNYQKREDSDKDEDLVRNYCQQKKIKFESIKLTKKDYQQNWQNNFQSLARNIRYNFFFDLAEKYQTKKIVIAHHLDDHLETYLLQKQKGNLVNYWGINWTSKQKGYSIYRPLIVLGLRKKEIIELLVSEKINYCIDSTNCLPLYQRNIARKELEKKSDKEIENLLKEIDQKNKSLKEKIQQVENLVRTNQKIIDIDHLQKNYDQEILIRFLFDWINSGTSGLLQKRKKKLLQEIYKQLFKSQKKTIEIKISNRYIISKKENKAYIKEL